VPLSATRYRRRGGRDVSSATPLLAVEDLHVHYSVRRARRWGPRGTVRAVDGVSFAVAPGRTLGLVGESGCGKSSAARAIIGLTEPTSGRIMLDERDLAKLSRHERKATRRHIQMVFQDPSSSLDPRMSVEEALAEPLQIAGMSRSDIKTRLYALLELVSLSPQYLTRYPHEFSGGQKQRIGIARALALEPKLLICDEPVSALDVSVQAQIINLFKDIQAERGISYLFVAHDLGVVRQVSHDIAVMYLGRIVEIGAKQEVYGTPRHPYTRALLAAAPRVRRLATKRLDIALLGADLPNPADPPSGCRFRTRCPHARERCAVEEPLLRDLGDGRLTACHFAESIQIEPSAPGVGMLEQLRQ
jgi:oligopeptide/dipeptide ABC transporter ATP-binding protein